MSRTYLPIFTQIDPDDSSQQGSQTTITNNVRRFYIKFGPKFGPKGVFNSDINFKNFVKRNYLTLSAFDVKPDLSILKTEQDFSDQNEDMPVDSSFHQTHNSSSDGDETGKLGFPNFYGSNEIMFPQRSESIGLDSNIAANKLSPESSSTNWSWPGETDLTFQEIENILSNQSTEPSEDFTNDDLDKLLKDCEDLGFNFIRTPDNAAQITSRPSCSANSVVQDSGCSPSILIEFVCTSNCQVKHVAKIGFSCDRNTLEEGFCNGPCTPNYRVSLSEETTPRQSKRIMNLEKTRRGTLKRKIGGRGQQKARRKGARLTLRQKKKVENKLKAFGINKTCYVVLNRIQIKCEEPAKTVRRVFTKNLNGDLYSKIKLNAMQGFSQK